MTLRDLLEAHPDGLCINELMVKSRLPHRQIKSELDKLPVVFDGEVYMLYQNPEQKALLQAKIIQNRDKEADKGATPKKTKRNPPFTPNPIMGYQVQKGKAKIFLNRRASSKTLTLSLSDLRELVCAVEKAGRL